MAIPLLVPIAYGIVRGLLTRYGSKKGVQTLMTQLKVSRNTAKELLATYNKVSKKGSITQSLNKKDVVSNKNVINVLVKPDEAAKLTSAVTKIGRGSNSTGKGATNFPVIAGRGAKANPAMPPEGKGFLATAKDVVTSPAATILGTGGAVYSLFGDEIVEPQGLNQAGKDAFYDENGNLVPIGTAEMPITKQSYNKFKDEFAAYQNSNKSFDTGSSLFDEALSSATFNENDPRNNPDYEQEYELYKREFGYADTRGKDIQDTPQGVQLAINNLVDENAPTQADINKNRQDLQNAQKNIANLNTLTSKEPPQNIYGDRFERIGEYDRNVISRTFGIGEEPTYRAKKFDSSTNRYVTDPNGQIFTESQMVDNSMIVTAPTSDNRSSSFNSSNSNQGNNQDVVTATQTVRPLNTRTQFADGSIRAADSVAKNAPASGTANDFAGIMGLVNYLGTQENNRNRTMGNTGNFNMGIFNNQTPIQQYYGARPVGFLDPEFYKQIGGMFQ